MPFMTISYVSSSILRHIRPVGNGDMLYYSDTVINSDTFQSQFYIQEVGQIISASNRHDIYDMISVTSLLSISQ